MEKMLVTSFSPFPTVFFKSLPSKGYLTYYHTIPHFDALKIYSCENHCEKRRNACNNQFLLFSQCILPYMPLIFHFRCTIKCCLQFFSIWNSLKFCRNRLNLELFGKKLTLHQTTNDILLQSQTVCRQKF